MAETKDNDGPTPNEILKEARKHQSNTYEDIPDEPQDNVEIAVIDKLARTDNKSGLLHLFEDDHNHSAGEEIEKVEKECSIDLSKPFTIKVTPKVLNQREWCSKCLLQKNKD